MNTLELLWYSIIAVAGLAAAVNWRQGISIGILIDALRDPIRKLIPGQPVMITLSGTLIWLCIILSVLLSRRAELRALYRQYPRLRTAMSLLLFAIIPAAGVTIVSYSRGWLVATIGAISYLVPTFGVLTGFAFVRSERDVANMMFCYVVVNFLMLLSVSLEYLKVDIPALGGVDHDWIRYRSGYIVDMMSGWYRSPDIMGLHAAHVIIFSIVLGIRPQSRARIGWLIPVLLAGFSVLVSGRRKMLGMPLVFVATYLIMGTIFKVARIGRLSGFVIVCLIFGGAASILLWSPDASSEYTNFASSLFTEGVERSLDLTFGSTLSTLQQAGVVGGGLGMATQGKYYAGVSSSRHLRGWQEDGISRLFFEFGIPGAMLLMIALLLLLQCVLNSFRGLPKGSREILMQLALVSILAADAASFTISHQQFSGDPVNALLVTLMLGMILKFPLVYRSPIHDGAPLRTTSKVDPSTPLPAISTDVLTSLQSQNPRL